MTSAYRLAIAAASAPIAAHNVDSVSLLAEDNRLVAAAVKTIFSYRDSYADEIPEGMSDSEIQEKIASAIICRVIAVRTERASAVALVRESAAEDAAWETSGLPGTAWPELLSEEEAKAVWAATKAAI